MQKTIDYPRNGQVTFVHVGKSYPADSSSISERSQLGKNIGPFSHGGLSAAPSGLNDSQHGGSLQVSSLLLTNHVHEVFRGAISPYSSRGQPRT